MTPLELIRDVHDDAVKIITACLPNINPSMRERIQETINAYEDWLTAEEALETLRNE